MSAGKCLRLAQALTGFSARHLEFKIRTDPNLLYARIENTHANRSDGTGPVFSVSATSSTFSAREAIERLELELIELLERASQRITEGLSVPREFTE